MKLQDYHVKNGISSKGKDVIDCFKTIFFVDLVTLRCYIFL